MKVKIIAVLVLFSLLLQVNSSFAHMPIGKEDIFNLNKNVNIFKFEKKANVEADSIIYGKIITLDLDREVVEAMVVKDGLIKYLGTKKVAKTMQGKNTKIYDYGESVIYPGFMDPHTHGVMAGQRLFMQCDLTPYDEGRDMMLYIKAMKDYVKQYPNKKFYLGAGWDKYEEPTASMLDEVSKDKPIALKSYDGHSMWINTKAMEECGINKEYAKKYGEALVHVDNEGNPTGFLAEEALSVVDNKYKPTKEDIKNGLLAWQDYAFSKGITAVGDAYTDMFPECIDAYAEFVKEGKWKLRTYGYFANSDITKTKPNLLGETLTKLSKKYNSEYFKVMGQKIILDGVIEAHTGALIDEYSDQKGYYGVLNIDNQELLNNIVKEVNGAGFPVHTHSIGDRASKMILDAYEKTSEEICDFDLRNVMCHLQLIRKEDIQRAADYNIIALVAPTWAVVEHPTFDESLKYLGEERAWQQYPIKSFRDAGATVCFHTDYPVDTTMNAPLSVYTAVTRALIDYDNIDKLDTSTILNADEAISSVDALLAMTTNVAYTFREENRLGTLEIGKIANATVYDKNFINLENPQDIIKSKLVATIVDGEEVYKAN